MQRKTHASLRIFPGIGLRLAAIPFDLIIREALNLIPDQLTNPPEWVKRDQWDVVAKGTDLSGRSDSDYRGMLCAIAVEYFHLRVHSTQRSFKGFALVIARKGEPSAGSGAFLRDRWCESA